MQSSEPEQELKELIAREKVRIRLPQSELERAEVRRRELAALLDDPPEAGWLRSSWGWLILAALLVALAAWIVYIALA
jgi:hypothetical protein